MISTVDVDTVMAALCCWREARGETNEAKIAQVWTVRNRVQYRWAGRTSYMDVITQPWQFSGMTAKLDPNLSQFPRSYDAIWLACLAAADAVISGKVEDPTQGAVFYHDVSIQGPPIAWGKVNKTVQIGKLIFYKEALAA